ncbi:MAG: Type IV pilus assembly protein PilB [Candidatus Collierbacteria bacterium GW2011_GWC2_45_15]|uniref:Type IV pilus assembly protein PilB n=1 Tax=Candidatus Collierbacteria bacterium GW2011_GWC2_45_15 TaxID=1618394 RepID=A0A0G1PRJ9_9BACT|nr:MAG: Type IV pilus assembly protein PilB [Candidatus Collierbacteria bacterium GW2011_GWC2_45_15]
MPDNASLFSSLSKMKVIDKKLLDEAWMETKESGRSFNDVLLGRDLITDENLGKLTADLLKVPFVRLSSLTIDKDVLNSISEEMSKNKKVIVFKVDTSTHVAMIDPEDLATINLIKKKVGDKVRVYYATERDVKAALLNYLTEVSKAFDLEIHKEGVRAEHIVNTILGQYNFGLCISGKGE